MRDGVQQKKIKCYVLRFIFRYRNYTKYNEKLRVSSGVEGIVIEPEDIENEGIV